MEFVSEVVDARDGRDELVDPGERAVVCEVDEEGFELAWGGGGDWVEAREHGELGVGAEVFAGLFPVGGGGEEEYGCVVDREDGGGGDGLFEIGGGGGVRGGV